MNNPQVTLEVSELSAGYGDIRVLTDISVQAWRGSVTAIFGANGAGKTTLLSAIAGLIPLKTGTVHLNGRDISNETAYNRSALGLGLVQEGKRLLHKRTVHENLLLGGYRLTRNQRKVALDGAYDRFPVLREKHDSKAGSLSGGQQQMLAIAQALMPAPQVVLLDEPSAGLAPIIVDDLLQTISDLKDEGVAVVLVEQLIGKAMSVADHVLAIRQGSVVINSPASHLDSAQLHAAYLGDETEDMADTEGASGSERART